MIGQVLGNYRVLRVLGEGGMGTVYFAEHALIGTKAAVKVLLPELSSNREIVNRFFNEARAAALINHRGIVQVFDFGTHEGSAYLVMEYLDGESLGARLKRERALPTEVVLTLARQLCGALGAAHAAGIVHRDLKPDNVFLVNDPDVTGGARVKVLDFGIAKLAGEASHGTKTRTGSVMGTPHYMSPEQCRGAGLVDARSDIYSVGCILYEMTTGVKPFDGEGPGDVLAAHLKEAPIPPRARAQWVSPAMETVLLRALAKRPDERPQTMQQLLAELDASGQWNGGMVAPGTFPPVAQTSSPTTLGGAVGQSYVTAPPARRRNAVLIAGGVAAAVLVALALTFGLKGGGETPRTSAAVVPVEKTPVVAPAPVAPVPEPAPVPPVSPVADPAPVAPVAPAARAETIVVTDPAGVEVHDDEGRVMGVTPLSISLAAGDGPRRLELKKRGYRTVAVSVKPGETVEVALEKVTRSGPARKDAKKDLKSGTIDPFAD